MSSTVREARSVWGTLAKSLWRAFFHGDLLGHASAISFQVLFALVPLLLAGLAVLGFLGLEDVWREELAPRAREQLPEDAFSVVDRTTDEVLAERRLLWLTLGLAFALWQLSSAIRSASGPLNRIYGLAEQRPWGRRMLVSFALAVAIAPMLLLALVGIAVGDELLGALDLESWGGLAAEVGRWTLSFALMLGALWLLLHYAPAAPISMRWTSVGLAIVVAGWTVVSLAYGWYVGSLASYESVFAGLASVVVLMTYVYLLAIVLLAGIVAGAALRAHLNDEPAAG